MPTGTLDHDLTKLKIDKAKKRPARRGFVQVLFSLLVLGGLGAGGFFAYTKVNAGIPVKVARAERETQASEGSAILTATGYVIPRNRIELSSKIVGRVKDIRIEEGDVVKQGDILLQIEDDEYAAQVKVAEARVASLKAHLSQLKAGSRPQEIEAAKAAVASAEATLKMTKADWDRLEPLAKENVISKQQLDQARQAYSVAQAQVDSAKKNAELVVIGPRKEEIDAAEAQLREAEANLSYAKTQLEFTVIRAPVTGTILEKLAKKGELVTNMNFGGTRGAKSSVVSMADLNDLQVELDLNENDLPKVKLKQKCEIRLDSHPNSTFKGEVDEIASQADRQKATVQVKVRMIKPEEFVRPEVNARVTFLEEKPVEKKEGTQEARVWIPRSALVSGPGGSKVFIVSDKTAVAREVKIGEEAAQRIEIKDGLVGTELLIIEPLDKIADGAKVIVTS